MQEHAVSLRTKLSRIIGGGDPEDSVCWGKVYNQVDMQGADLSGRTFIGCYFAEANLVGCDASKATFIGCTFEGCYVVKSKFTGALFEDCRFMVCGFQGSAFEGVRFGGTKMIEVLFTDALMTDVGMYDCRVEVGDFSSANMERTHLIGVVLVSCNFDYANLNEVRLQSVSLADTAGMSSDDPMYELLAASSKDRAKRIRILDEQAFECI